MAARRRKPSAHSRPDGARDAGTRRVVYSVAASLDGFIAGPHGEFDWIPMDPSFDWVAHMGRFDTVLMGRRTYEIASAPDAPKLDMRSYVFSTRLRASEHPGVTVVARDAARVVRELAREPGKDIWLMGGGELFRSLLEAGAVDRVEVGVIPILLGEGVPLLPGSGRRTKLELVEARSNPSGTVRLSYDVVR